MDNDGDVAGQRRSAWCARLGAHIAELQSQLNRIKALGPAPADAEVVAKADVQLEAARQALSDRHRLKKRVVGVYADAALANVHEAEVGILRLLPAGELGWQGSRILTHARLHLAPDDQCLVNLQAALERNGNLLTPDLRDLAVSTLHAANQAEEAERARVRSFGQIVAASVVMMTVIAAALTVWGFLVTGVAEKFCFNPPEGKVCPIGDSAQGGDLLLVQFIGALAAALAGAVSLRKIQGTSGPYHIAVLLLVLRLPVGALSAALGLLLLSGEFLPGLSNLDTEAQIVAWAAGFGILQETVTRAVDRQGQLVLDNVRGPARGFEP
ncbi:hypothetical protein [Streptomyces sp. NPDC006134]|uniref:hypothetical protein n=1 Tax=Streptomyces sp. NPDC006134 TaxID=3154467 RepID=UPI0033CCBE5C